MMPVEIFVINLCLDSSSIVIILVFLRLKLTLYVSGIMSFGNGKAYLAKRVHHAYLVISSTEKGLFQHYHSAQKPVQSASNI
jgi:hypothetical protein